jgi:hypothetical protein
MRSLRQACGLLLLGLFAAALACAHASQADSDWQLAATKGKYHVQLTEDTERVQGTCKFVRLLNPQFDQPMVRPTDAQLPDAFRTEAAYYGADTVLVRDNVGEAYICGPGPINPDGTRKEPYPKAQ